MLPSLRFIMRNLLATPHRSLETCNQCQFLREALAKKRDANRRLRVTLHTMTRENQVLRESMASAHDTLSKTLKYADTMFTHPLYSEETPDDE